MNEVSKGRPVSHSCFSQRLRLHFLDWGNHDAPNVLLVHGVQDHCHSWDWVSEILCSDYHVVVPDLRGHGDSEWNRGSSYNTLDYVYDIAQLVDQFDLAPVHIIAHSMGGNIASIYAGTYPDKVASFISVEGVGGWRGWFQGASSPQERVRTWVDGVRGLAGRVPRRYETLSDAFQRMQKSNPHLSEAQARHLTIHGANRNEDGTYTWKFDNYTHSRAAYSIPYDDMTAIWDQIDCPMLMINATNGYGHRTGQGDSLPHFRGARVVNVDGAGHWVHHDQFDTFMKLTQDFLAEVTG
ncbi:MAG TPA: alpha/beta hydrolase [Pseudomonadales bacterium]|nr:alpha/beta hydrolase [Pseudomonadales bacterium]